jgi:hypothetical protein
MKKIVLLVALMLSAAFTINAQINTATKQLFDMDFEHWTNRGTYEDPDSIRTTNQYTGLAGAILVTKGTDSYHGASCLKLTTTHIVFLTINGTYPGVVSNGVINGAVLGGGTGAPIVSGKKIDYRPSAFSFWYKNSVAGHDSSSISIFLTKWNSSLGKRDTVGNLIWIDTVAHPNYTHVIAPINYLIPITKPDTFQISMMSSGINHSTVGSVFTLDSMNFAPDTSDHHIGISTLAEGQSVKIAPNPANETLTISFENSAMNQMLSITDITGKLILKESFSNTKSLIVKDWAIGTYFYSILNSKGNAIHKGKFEVIH